MTYCAGKIKAVVEYLKPNKQKAIYQSNKVPINIEIEPAKQGLYRFYGIGDDDLAYSFTAAGINPGYSRNTGFNGRGYTPTMDGVFIKPQSYYYVRAYGIETIESPEKNCTIKVTGSGNNFSDSIECPDGSYKVSCGEECPFGHIKCKKDSYPGYCCIPCSEIKGGIQAATAMVKVVNRG